MERPNMRKLHPNDNLNLIRKRLSEKWSKMTKSQKLKYV
jgi:hypothetical protein